MCNGSNGGRCHQQINCGGMLCVEKVRRLGQVQLLKNLDSSFFFQTKQRSCLLEFS